MCHHPDSTMSLSREHFLVRLVLVNAWLLYRHQVKHHEWSSIQSIWYSACFSVAIWLSSRHECPQFNHNSYSILSK
uniref:Putative ovule protein n=1 Tax=Solanum chacoense TaxID=4108 RepID=A0A0V0H842_SOLCH